MMKMKWDGERRESVHFGMRKRERRRGEMQAINKRGRPLDDEDEEDGERRERVYTLV